MKSALSLLVLACAALTPELALAKAVEDVRLDTDGADVVVTVVADEPLHAPSVRTSAGSVRVRFYDATETKLVRLPGDGGAVRSVELARGSDRTAALTLMFGDRTKLAISDVRVETDGDTTTLRIARGLLPAVRDGVVPAPALVAAPKAQPAAVTPKPQPAAAVAAKPQPVTAPQPSSVTVRTEDVKSPVLAPTSAPVQLGAKAAPEKSKELKLNTNESSPVPTLLAVSALLALAYGGLQLMMKKRKTLPGSDFPAIDVISQKRLGPRHQLVIVRAFDRDYLLSIQGGQTTVVARSSRKKLDAAEALLSPLPRRRTESTASSPSRDFERDDEPTFGGDLFKQALDQRERAREQTASYRLEQARADARAEARAEPEIIEAPTAPEPPASAVSDSVSGLLRLRKQAGR